MDTEQQIVQELYSIGMTDSEIAFEVDSTQPTINRIRNGASKSCDSDLYRALFLLRKKVVRRSVKKAA